MLVGLFAYVVAYYTDIFTTQAGARRLRGASATSPRIKALTGLAAAPATLGGAVWTKIWMTCALSLAFGVVFLVTRNGRADEEVGRTELLRSRMLGLHAYSVASWLVSASLCVAVGVGVALVSAAGGLDPAGTGITGSLIVGASMTGVGLVGARRRRRRRSGDLDLARRQRARLDRPRRASTSCGWSATSATARLTWASPIGWGQQMQPWGANRWWPLGCSSLLDRRHCSPSRARLEARRDLGAGLLPERARPRRRPGPVCHSARAGAAAAARSDHRLDRRRSCSVPCCSARSSKPMNDLMADAGSTVAALLRGTGVDALLSLLLAADRHDHRRLRHPVDDSPAGRRGQRDHRAATGGRDVAHPLGTRAPADPGRRDPRLLLLVGGGLHGRRLRRDASVTRPGRPLALAALAYWPAVMVFVGIAVAAVRLAATAGDPADVGRPGRDVVRRPHRRRTAPAELGARRAAVLGHAVPARRADDVGAAASS